MAINYPATQTQVLRRGAGFMTGARIHAGGATPATINIYDGIAANGELKASLTAGVNETVDISPSRMPFFTGLYIEVSGNPTHASIDVDV